VGRLKGHGEAPADQHHVADTGEAEVAGKDVNLNEALVDCLDVALTDLFGAVGKEAIYDHMGRELSFTRKDIPAHLDGFREELKTNFGVAAPEIECFIARKFYASLNRQFLDVADFGLSEHFELVKGIDRRSHER
jgi:hypothetical protein